MGGRGQGFVGRRRELAELEAAIDAGRRVVVVWGPGGTGKTRLARELARRRAARGEPVAAFDLSLARDDADVRAALADALELGGHPTAERLGSALASRGALLLVVEHVERVAGAMEAALAGWLRAAPSLQVLVTSRERLRLGSELTIELGPLSLPASDEAVAESEAVELLVDRVRGRGFSLEVGPANAPLLRALVERVEGSPLALELCAARVGVLGLEKTLERLEHPLEGLDLRASFEGAFRDQDERHRTLRRTVEWSWTTLSAGERDLLAAASIFVGGFDLDAAEAVLGGDPEDVIEGLDRLRDKSLITVSDPSRATVRFGLYHPIREFGLDELVARGTFDEVAARHVAHYLGRVEALEGGDASALEDLANFEAALAHLLDRPLDQASATAAQRLALGVEAVASRRGSLATLVERLDRVIDATAKLGDPRLAVRLLGARGRTRSLLGEHDRAAAELEAAQKAAGRLPDRELEAELAIDLGVLHHKLRRIPAARAAYERALALLAGGSPRLGARVRGNLGALAHDELDLARARQFYEEALTAARRARDPRLEGVFRGNLGVLEHERGALADAEDHLERSVRCLEQVGDHRLRAISLGNLGAVRTERGDLEGARALHLSALRLLRAAGDRRSETLALCRLAAVESLQGNPDEGLARVEAARALAGELDDPTLSETVELFRAFADRAARGAEAEIDVAGRIARAEHGDGGPSLADRSDDARLAIRLLGAEPPEARPVDDRDALVIGPGAEWYRPPRGEWQDFRRRQAPRRVLLALVERRRAEPGRGLSTEEVFAAGWPGERVLPDSAQNRVWVTLATLRKLGLKEVLLSRAEGYLLDPAVPVLDTDAPFERLVGGGG